MGTITTRKRKDGTAGYTAQIVRKKGGAIVWREAKTFDKKQEAKQWISYRETELDKPGAIDALKKTDSTLADTIDRYTKEHPAIGRTKAHSLRTVKTFAIASMANSAIKSKDIVAFADELAENGRKPQTIASYVSHLASVFRDAKSAWDIDLDYAEMQAAQRSLTRLKKIATSDHRERRPSLDELDTLMEFFLDRQDRHPNSTPMHIIIPFAIFSTRRQEEITRLAWADLDEAENRILVRDMKNPGQKRGNDVWCELPPEALRIIKAQPKQGKFIFPYTTDGIGRSFTRAVYFLGISTVEMPEAERLHFHDLRHEGVSRLFEMGKTIPLAASVSGHRSWASLQRYAQIRKSGDKFVDWPWLDVICGPAEEKV